MIGVIVLSGPFAGMHGLDADRSPSLLPLGDRPALQHIVESLVTQGITQIELIVGHGPELVEHLLGTGDRWGCSFKYHLAAQPDRPYRSLKVIARLAEEPWLLVHAERFPCVEFPSGNNGRMVAYNGVFAAKESWGGTLWMPATQISEEMASFSEDEMDAFVRESVERGDADVISTEDWLDVSSPARILESQARLLDRKLRGLLISGAEREPGIWVARNATIHPSVRLTAPLYIGTNTRLERGVRVGPYAVIGPDCIVDSKTVIEKALVMEGSYVGEGLEVHEAIVSHNLLVNVRLDASVDIGENFLLGRLDRPRPSNAAGRVVQTLLATVMAVLFSPILAVSWLIMRIRRGAKLTQLTVVCLPANDRPQQLETFVLPCFGADAWAKQLPAGWGAFTQQFLPGLFAVAGGKLGLVGLPPRTPAQVAELDDDWREIYLNGHAGLITEAAVADTDTSDNMQLYLAEAYYSVQQNARHKVALTLKYFGRLIVPAKKRR